jgi:hypothetical protein
MSPVEASSGEVTRHRLNRGGDCEANSSLWRIVMVRMPSTWSLRTAGLAPRRLTTGGCFPINLPARF